MSVSGDRAFLNLISTPAKFVRLCWPDMSLYKLQNDVIESVEQNYRTCVPSANQMGKTMLASVTALYFFMTRHPARVIATSSSASQLETILWNQIRDLISKSRVKLPIQVNHLLLRKLDRKGQLIPSDYCVGHVTNSVESFQGHHLPNDKPRVLAIFEESCHDDITEVCTDAGWKLFANLDGSERLLSIDIATMRCDYHSPTAIQKSFRSGEMYEYDRCGCNFRVTPNHRMLYRQAASGAWLLDEIRNITGDFEIPGEGLLQVQQSDLRRVHYEGYVYCATVPPHHTLLTRRNGKVMWSGNSGINDIFVAAAESWAHRILAIGNPLSTTNFFYKSCKLGDVPSKSHDAKYLNKVIHLDGLYSPNVQIGLEYERRGIKKKPPIIIPGLLTLDEYRTREAIWDDVQRHTRLRGKFYEGQDELLYPMDWLDAAQEMGRFYAERPRVARAMGIDVAAGGSDKTVWTIIDEHGVIKILSLDTPDTTEIPSRTIALMKQYNIPPGSVAMDAGGGGKQLVDRLVELGHRIRIVSFGEAAGAGMKDTKEAAELRKAYSNRRSEMYGALRFRMNPATHPAGFCIPPDASELRKDLSIMPLKYDSEGRMYLPPKRANKARDGQVTIESLLGRSPDFADSLVLAVWADDMRNAFTDWKPTEETWKSVDDRAERLAKKMAERLGEA